MMTVIWGLLSALSWGTGDFCGGLAARRLAATQVVFYADIVGLVLFALLGWLLGEPAPRPVDLVWGAISGLVGMIGLVTLYRAMALGQVTVVAPLSAMISLMVPIVVGIWWQGMPGWLKLIGFGLALVSVALISGSMQGGQADRSSLLNALVAGLGFGGFFIGMTQVQDGSVFWPLVATRIIAIVLLWGLIQWSQGGVSLPSASTWGLITLVGIFDGGGNLFFVLAEQAGRLDIASTLSSLYPAMTVLLGLLILRERLTRWQSVGVALALATIPVITL
jgi:drug/metabolite transporter (DMT)-like permease